MDAEEWSSSSEGVSDSDACFEDSKDEEFWYDISSLNKLQFRKQSLKACWKDDMGMAEVMEHKGRLLTTMGIVRSGKIFCSVEETLFLVEIGALLLVDDKDTTILLGEIYAKIAEGKAGCSWEGFEVYRHLKSLGYIIGRYGIPWSLKGVKSCSGLPDGASGEDNSAQSESDGKHNSTETDLDENSISELLNGLELNELKPLFEVYLPNSLFRKTSSGAPSFLVYMARGHPPSRTEIEEVEKQCNGIPLKIGHVEHGRVSFFSYNKVELLVLP